MVDRLLVAVVAVVAFEHNFLATYSIELMHWTVVSAETMDTISEILI